MRSSGSRCRRASQTPPPRQSCSESPRPHATSIWGGSAQRWSTRAPAASPPWWSIGNHFVGFARGDGSTRYFMVPLPRCVATRGRQPRRFRGPAGNLRGHSARPTAYRAAKAVQGFVVHSGGAGWMHHRPYCPALVRLGLQAAAPRVNRFAYSGVSMPAHLVSIDTRCTGPPQTGAGG